MKPKPERRLRPPQRQRRQPGRESRTKKVATFGSSTPMRRAGEPAEIAPCFVFLACDDASYMTGQVLHPNGGEIVNT